VNGKEFLDLLRETDIERTLRLQRNALLGPHDWRWYTTPEWAELEAQALEKDRLSDSVSWTRRWSPEFNLLGEVGEETYARILGVNRTSHFGDGGQDFPGVDVKATSRWQKPRLLRLVGDLLRASFYCLVAVDLTGQRARYVGYATRKELEEAKALEYGYGPTRTIFADALHEGLPR
jgi:hypothetical protein